MTDREELARTSMAAFNRRDVEVVVRTFADDAEWWPLRSSTEGPYRGHDGIRAWFEDTAEMFEYLRAEGDESDERDDIVVAFGRLEVKGRASIWELLRLELAPRGGQAHHRHGEGEREERRQHLPGSSRFSPCRRGVWWHSGCQRSGLR